MLKLTRRAALFGSGAVLGGYLTSCFRAELPTLAGTRLINSTPESSSLNDASGLSKTPISRHVIMTEDPGKALVAAIRAEIAEARSAGRSVNVSAARHSMGGQSIPRDGHAITFDNGWLELDREKKLMRVHAGARWAQVIAALDPKGFGPRVMQSNNDFGVAATFCVNAHGWPVREGPMGSTVRAFDIVVPDGTLLTCSREENSELFYLTMGGYGLTGAIVRMDVDITENQLLRPEFEEMPAEEFGNRFSAALEDKQITMAYGRLNVDRARFFETALMITYRPVEDQSEIPAATGSGAMAKLASRVYRAQLGNERLKRLRWWTESVLNPRIGSGAVTRNSLINEPVVTLDDRDLSRTDILHEYFVHPDRFGEFVEICREIIPASYQEFLNVTLRFVDADPDSLLSYAPVPRIAAVMSFSQEMTARAEADMRRMTQDLIDAVVAIGGTYYLPYRPHARLEQLVKAYPRAQEFVAAKRNLDPGLNFRNNLWDSYLGLI